MVVQRHKCRQEKPCSVPGGVGLHARPDVGLGQKGPASVDRPALPLRPE